MLLGLGFYHHFIFMVTFPCKFLPEFYLDDWPATIINPYFDSMQYSDGGVCYDGLFCFSFIFSFFDGSYCRIWIWRTLW